MFSIARSAVASRLAARITAGISASRSSAAAAVRWKPATSSYFQPPTATSPSAGRTTTGTSMPCRRMLSASAWTWSTSSARTCSATWISSSATVLSPATAVVTIRPSYDFGGPPGWRADPQPPARPPGRATIAAGRPVIRPCGATYAAPRPMHSSASNALSLGTFTTAAWPRSERTSISRWACSYAQARGA